MLKQRINTFRGGCITFALWRLIMAVAWQCFIQLKMQEAGGNTGSVWRKNSDKVSL